MPATSSAQYGLMQMAAKGIGAPAKKVKKNVAKEFISKTAPSKRSSFAKAIATKRGNSDSDFA